jgi:hypothetical protein
VTEYCVVGENSNSTVRCCIRRKAVNPYPIRGPPLSQRIWTAMGLAQSRYLFGPLLRGRARAHPRPGDGARGHRLFGDFTPEAGGV